MKFLRTFIVNKHILCYCFHFYERNRNVTKCFVNSISCEVGIKAKPSPRVIPFTSKLNTKLICKYYTFIHKIVYMSSDGKINSTSSCTYIQTHRQSRYKLKYDDRTEQDYVSNLYRPLIGNSRIIFVIIRPKIAIKHSAHDNLDK